MTTMEQIHRIRELYYEQDKSLNEIAIIMVCNWRSVRKYVDMENFNIPPPYRHHQRFMNPNLIRSNL